MAIEFKNMALAGANDGAVNPRSSARKRGGMRWRGYLVSPSPLCPNQVGQERTLAASTEGMCLRDRRQLKI
jgi:hypothetical protein